MSRPQRANLVMAGSVTLGVLAVAVIVLVRATEDPQEAPAPLKITEAGATIEARSIETPIEVLADGVTIRNVEVATAGKTVITIGDEVRGTVIEDVVVRCRSSHARGIAPGHYTATRVKVYGCSSPFVSAGDRPAVIVDSSADDKDVLSAAQLPGETGSGTPRPTASPTASPSRRASSPPAPTRPGENGTSVSVPTSFPGPDTTGVPRGTHLTNSGDLTITIAGKVISGLNINGCVNVQASNVVIRKSKIHCTSGRYAIRTYDGATNLVVEDVEIDGGAQTSAAVCCNNYTLRRVNIHNVIDGPRLGNNTAIIDSWIHHLARVSGSHNDALQTTGASNITVRHNRLEPYNPDTKDPFNAALMIGSTTGPEVRNLVFEQNFANGGNYTIGIRTDLNASGIVFRANTFGTNYRYGVVAHHDHPGVTWESNNIFLGTGRPVVGG